MTAVSVIVAVRNAEAHLREALTEQLAVYLCRRRGIAPEQAAPLSMETYREQQFDRLADGVRLALDMDAVYAAMGLKNPKGASL